MSFLTAALSAVVNNTFQSAARSQISRTVLRVLEKYSRLGRSDERNSASAALTQKSPSDVERLRTDLAPYPKSMRARARILRRS